MRYHLALVLVVLGCLKLTPPPDPPPILHLLSVTAGSAPLDRIGRMPVLQLHFDHPLAPPSPNAAMLVTGVVTTTLATDAAHDPPPATVLAREVAVTIARDPVDHTTLTVTPTAPLLPDTPLVLLIMNSVQAADTAVFANDGGTHAIEIPLQVAPARECGAVVTLPAVGGVFPERTPLPVQFDRPVEIGSVPQGVAPGLQVLVAGWPIPTAWSLDCLRSDGSATCAWCVPALSMSTGVSVTVRAVGLVTHDGLPVENTPTVTIGNAPATVVPYGPAPVCDDGEMLDGPLCISASDAWITLRATTPAPTVFRAEAVPIGSDGGVSGAALSAPGVEHTLVIAGLRASTTYTITLAPAVEALPRFAWSMGMITTPGPQAQVRLTEILCHPYGGAAQAYVEIANDDTTDADLSGWVLRMGTHRVTLADGAVAPASVRTVIVGADYNPLGFPDVGDPPLAPGAGVIVTTSTLSEHGLVSTGSDVALEDPNGTIISFFPGSDPQRAPLEGVSLVRAALDLADADPAAWSWDAAGSCTPGGPDRLR